MRCNLSDSEIDDFSALLHIISAYWIRTSIEDSLVWWPDPTGCFSIKSFNKWYNRVTTTAIVNPEIWNSKAPPRAICFLWTAGMGKILTQDNLCKRGRIIVSAYPLCLQASEETNHFLIHCPFSYAVWVSVLQKLDVLWVMSSTVASLSFAWTLF